MYNNLSKTMPDNRYTRKYLKDFPKMAEEYRKESIRCIPYSLFKLFQTTGSRVEYEAEYFAIRKRCDVFTAMVLMGHKEYLQELQDAINAILEEYTWALPAHIDTSKNEEEKVTTIDLFASETAFMLSEILYILHDELEPEINSRIIHELKRRITNPYSSMPTIWHKNNWSAVCAHGVLVTYIYLGLDDELKTALPNLLDSLNGFLESYQDDGYCAEGPLYWSYGFESFVYAASLIREYTKGNIDYFKQEKVHAIAKYGFYTYFDDNKTLPFADAPHRLNYNIGLYHFLKKEYPELPLPEEERAAGFGDESRCRFFEMMRNLYWFDENLKPDNAEIKSVDFSSSQVYIRNKEKYHFACKGGHNAEPHNHNDIGSFTVIAGDDYVLDDPGWEEYDRDYFGNKRYTNYICAMSQGHSLPIVDGNPQKSGSEYKAVMLNVSENNIAMDLTNAYGLENVKVFRSFELLENGVLINDTVEGVRKWVCRMVTRIRPDILPDGSVQIGYHILKSDTDKTPEINERTFTPRLVSNIGTKPIETLYMIDFYPEKNTCRVELKV